MSNCSMISSMLAPASRFSNPADTGIMVSRNTHAPLSLPGTLSTAGHCDQSRAAIVNLLFVILAQSPARRFDGETGTEEGYREQGGGEKAGHIEKQEAAWDAPFHINTARKRDLSHSGKIISP